MKWDEDGNNVLMRETAVCVRRARREARRARQKKKKKRKTERKEPNEPQHERAEHRTETTTKGAAENKLSAGKRGKESMNSSTTKAERMKERTFEKPGEDKNKTSWSCASLASLRIQLFRAPTSERSSTVCKIK
jgi:hypothetical protein